MHTSVPQLCESSILAATIPRPSEDALRSERVLHIPKYYHALPSPSVTFSKLTRGAPQAYTDLLLFVISALALASPIMVLWVTIL